jgi:hypothetical protein
LANQAEKAKWLNKKLQFPPRYCAVPAISSRKYIISLFLISLTVDAGDLRGTALFFLPGDEFTWHHFSSQCGWWTWGVVAARSRALANVQGTGRSIGPCASSSSNAGG